MGIFLIVFVVVVALAAIVIFNSIVAARNNVGESFSAIDTVLQTRYDLVPNLVAVVKGYAAHESAVFSRVTELRSSLLENRGVTSERFARENELQAGMKSIFALAEGYPDLKASANFLDLQERLSLLEERLQAARRAYNAAVKELNNKKQMFPTNLVAGAMNLPPYAMFEADAAAGAVPSVAPNLR